MKLLVKQPNMFAGTYEVYKENKVLAKLSCKGIFQLQALAEIEDHKVNFEQKGWFRTSVLVKDIKTGKIIATYYSNIFSNGGVLKYNENEQYIFKSKSWWKSEYIWLDKNANELIGLKTGGLLKMNGAIDVFDETLNEKKRMLLILLGLYQIKLINDSSSSASGAAA